MTQTAKTTIDSEKVFEGPEFERLEAALGVPNARSDSTHPQSLNQSQLPPLSRIAQLILEIDSHAIAGSDSKALEILTHNRALLAAQLGCTPDDLQGVVESYGDQWQEYVLEERIRLNMDSTHMRDNTWDKLESVTLNKLVLLVEKAGNRLTVEQLLAVARTANMANRGDRSQKGPGQGVGGGPVPVTVQVGNFLGGDVANGVLPAGNLGTISLNLSQRVLRQLSTPKEIEGESTRVLDSMEMMGIKEIQKIGEGMDKENKDDSK